MKQVLYFVIFFSISGLNSCCIIGNEDSRLWDRRTELLGVKVFTSIKLAQKASKKSGKNILLVFDSPNCGSLNRPRKMIFEILRNDDFLANQFEITYLAIDDRTQVKSRKFMSCFGLNDYAKTKGEENMVYKYEIVNDISPYQYVIIKSDLTLIRDLKIDKLSNEKILKFLK